MPSALFLKGFSVPKILVLLMRSIRAYIWVLTVGSGIAGILMMTDALFYNDFDEIELLNSLAFLVVSYLLWFWLRTGFSKIK